MRLRHACALILCSLCEVASAQGKDGGGRDVSVALFSTGTAQSVTATPLSSNAWTARCATCPHTPLTGPLTSTDNMDLFLGGTLRMMDNATHETRTATGLWHLRDHRASRSVDVVLTMPSERYLAAVLNAEAAHDEPPQSLQALAIVARTFALNGRHYTAQAGHLDADLCDSTQCQAMLLQPPSQAVEDATRATAGETLWLGAHRAEVYFSQNCGGLTEEAGAVWPKLKNTPYLQSHADPYCLRRPSSAWHAEVSLTEFLAVAKSEEWRIPTPLVAAYVVDRSRSHRALHIAFKGPDGTTATLSAGALRFGLGRALGWNRVRSDSYELALRKGALIFDGRGHGHGVGLCQAGATEMAAEGKSARDILAFYFPGTSVSITNADNGWHEICFGALTVRSTRDVPVAQQAAWIELWSEAQRRFPPAHAVAPEIVLAPTTEMFRQLTTQPGWALASTQGSTIVLQPESVFAAQDQPIADTVLHEMLHVAVETACSGRTPIWLREGLVEALSGEAARPGPALSLQTIENALQHADSLKLSRQAHAAAAAKVRALITRYGMFSVRGWLSSGVPAGIS